MQGRAIGFGLVSANSTRCFPKHFVLVIDTRYDKLESQINQLHAHLPCRSLSVLNRAPLA